MEDPLDAQLDQVAQTIAGPRGGKLDTPYTEALPAWRRADLRCDILPDGEKGLHKFEDTTNPGRKNEQPWHRLAACLLVEGKSREQVASIAGVSVATVSQLKAQLWFQQMMAEMANGVVSSRLDRLSAELDTSIDTLVRLRDFSENERVVADISKFFVEHTVGKPVQKVISVNATTHYSSEQEEFEAIQQELEALKKAKEQTISAGAVSTPNEQEN